MMLDKVTYDKIKIIYELSKVCWFIEKHAKNDAKSTGDQELLASLTALQNDLEKHIEKIQNVMCRVTQ